MASTILVADDDRAIRMVLNQALIRLGHDVRMTGNAATLWRWVADGEGDLVITDVIMPDENGLDLIPRIKKIRPELRIIVMSAQNTLLTAVISVFCALITMMRSSGRIFLMRGIRSRPFSSGMMTSVMTRSPSPSATHRHKVAALPVIRTSWPSRISA